mgnify:CR=1 FL=1
MKIALLIGLILTELASSLIGFAYWKKIRNTYWKWFPVYLGIIAAIEIAGFISAFVFTYYSFNKYLFLYFGIPFQFIFFFWLFRKYFTRRQESVWTFVGLVVYLVAWVLEKFLWGQGQRWFSSFSYTIGNIILLVLIILFFIRFINSEEILRYRNSMMFWVSLGLIVFYLGTFPFYALRNTLANNYAHIHLVYSYVSLALDYLMYLLFIVAFIWGKPR